MSATPSIDVQLVQTQVDLGTTAICGVVELIQALRPIFFDPGSIEVGSTLFARLSELCDALHDLMSGFGLNEPTLGMDDLRRVVQRYTTAD